MKMQNEESNRLRYLSLTPFSLLLLLFLCVPCQTLAQARTSVKGHDPEYGRDLVLRMERFRTCDECPHYEIKIFADGSSMFHGKDAVRLLGKWGSYLARTELDRNPASQYRSTALIPLMDKVRHISNKYARNAAELLNEKKVPTREVRRVVIEAVGSDTPLLDFDYAVAPDDLRTLVMEVENHFASNKVFLDVFTEPAPLFFSDATAVFYWSFPILSEICGNFTEPGGAINIRMYSDGRVRMEYVNPLVSRDYPWTPPDTPVIQVSRDPAYVRNLITRLLAEWSGYANATQTLFKEEDWRGGAHMQTQASMGRAFKLLYVKSTANQAIDLTAAWYYRARKSTSQELKSELVALAFYALERFSPDDVLVQRCLRLKPN